MTTLDQRLRAADPAARLSGYDEATIDRAITAILSESAEPRSDLTARAAHRPMVANRRRTLYLAAACAAAVSAAYVVPGLSSDPSTPLGASPAAAAVLNRAASVPAVDPAARGDQYWAIRTTGTNTNTAVLGDSSEGANSAATYLVTGLSTDYVAVDGSRPSWFASTHAIKVRQLGGPRNVGRPTRMTSAWTSNLSPQQMPQSWQVPSPAFLAALPRDVTALRARLYADTAGRGRSPDGEVLVYVADVLRSGLVPADLRSALYRVLETVPGVEVTDSRATIDGRVGTALGRLETVDGQRQELVIDAASGDVIGERTVQVDALDGIPAGTVTQDTAVTRTLVDDVPADVRRSAVRQHCTVNPDGAVMCTEPS